MEKQLKKTPNVNLWPPLMYFFISAPTHRPRQSRRGSRGRPIGPAARRSHPPPREGEAHAVGRQRGQRGPPRPTAPAGPAVPPPRAPASRPRRPVLTGPRSHLAPSKPTAEAARSGKWRRWGRGARATFPGGPRQAPSGPTTAESGARPCSPKRGSPGPAHRASPPLPRRLRRSVTARQRTRTNPLPPQRRAPLAVQASAVVRGRSDWPRTASITAPRTPPSAGDSLWVGRPRA